MLNKNWIILFLLLIGSLTANSQTKLGFTYGLSQTMNSPGGEESEAIWATGVFIGYPFRISGNKHQFIIQPDLSISKAHDIMYSSYPDYNSYYMGANIAIKYSYITQKKKISAGYRGGFEGMSGPIGWVLEYDYRISKKLMLGFGLNSQIYLGSFTEGYTGLKLQLTHRID